MTCTPANEVRCACVAVCQSCLRNVLCACARANRQKVGARLTVPSADDDVRSCVDRRRIYDVCLSARGAHELDAMRSQHAIFVVVFTQHQLGARCGGRQRLRKRVISFVSARCASAYYCVRLVRLHTIAKWRYFLIGER